MGNDASQLEVSQREKERRFEVAKQLVEHVDDAKLLELLDHERELFTFCDERILHLFVDELIRRNVYPIDTVPGNPNTVYVMVQGWGSDWYLWKEPLECPHCKADLRCHRTGPPFKREIGHVSEDRMSHYSCPDCKGTWPR